MNPTAITVLVSLLAMALVGFAYGWIRGNRSAQRRHLDEALWRQREVEQQQHELDSLREQLEAESQRAAGLAKRLEAAQQTLLDGTPLVAGEAVAGATGADSLSPEADAALAEELTQLRIAVDERDDRIERLERRLEATLSELAAKQQQVQELTSDVADARTAAAAASAPAGIDAGSTSAPLATLAFSDDSLELEELRSRDRLREQELAGIRQSAGELEQRLLQQLEDREREAAELRSTAQTREEHLARVRAELAELQGAFTRLESESAQQLTSIQHLEARCSTRDNTIRSLEQELAGRSETVATLRAEAAALEESYRAQVDERDRRIAELEQHGAEEDRLFGVERTEFARIRTELEHQAEEAARATARLVRQDVLLGDLREQAERASLDLEEARARIAILEQERAAQIDRIGLMTRDVAARGEEQARLREEARDLEARYTEQLRAQVDETSAVRAALSGAREQAEVGAKKCLRLEQRVSELEGELASTTAGRARLQQRLDAAAARAEELQLHLEDRESVLSHLRAEAAAIEESYREQVRDRDARITELEASTLETADLLEQAKLRSRQEADRIEATLETAAASEAARARALEQAEALDKLLNQTRDQAETERAAWAAESGRLQAAAAEQAARLAERDRELAQLRLQVDASAGEQASLLEGVERDRETYERRLRERELQVSRLERVVESLRGELAELQSRATEDADSARVAQERLAAESERARSVETRLTENEETIAALRQDLDQRERLLASVRADLTDLEVRYERRLRERQSETERLQKLTEARETEITALRALLEQTNADFETVQARLARRDARIAEIDGDLQRLQRMRERFLRELHDREREVRQFRTRFKADPLERDDLKLLRGIGTVFERELNHIGITTFDQIAAWTAEDVEWIEERLPSVRGRIESEDWVEQAARLMRNRESADAD